MLHFRLLEGELVNKMSCKNKRETDILYTVLYNSHNACDIWHARFSFQLQQIMN